MSQFFSFSRFGRLFSKHTTEQASGYLLATGVLLGGIGLVLGFSNYMSSEPMPPVYQALFFSLGLLSTGAFFSSMVFAPFGERKQATALLLLPASHWEKYLVGWLYSLPIFTAVYIGCFYLIDSLALQLRSTPAHPAELLPLFGTNIKIYGALVAYAVVNAVFLWGSIFFTRQQFVRMAFGVLMTLVVLTMINFQALKVLLGPSFTMAVPFSDLILHEGLKQYHLELPPAQLAGFGLVPLGLVLLAWAAAYVRLKEKQI